MIDPKRQHHTPARRVMGRLFSRGAAMALVAAAIYGCFAPPRPVATPAPAPPSAPVVSADNAYYHFLRAQQAQAGGHLNDAISHLQKAIQLDGAATYLKKQLAALWMAAKETRKALDVFEEVIRQDPNDVDALLMAGRAQLELKQNDDAIETFKKALAKDDAREEIYLTLGNTYYQKKDLKNAEGIYRRLVKKHPESFVGYFYLGKIYTDLDRPADAEKAFKKTLTLASDLEAPRFQLIDLYLSGGQSGKARKYYQEILSRNPHNIRAAMGLGLLDYRQKHKKAAAARFKDLGRLSLADRNVVSTLIDRYIEKKKFGDTIILTEGMLKGAPESIALHYLAGMAYAEKDNPDMELRHFRQVPPDNKFYANAALQIAFILHDQGKTEAAISQVRALISQVPDDPEAYLYLGIFHEDLKQSAAARDALKKGLAVAPDNTHLLFRLGVVFDKMGRKDACIDTMSKVIQLDPRHANALNYLGYTYADLGKKLPEAEKLVKAAIALKPEDGFITDSLGWVYFKSGRYDEALKVLLKAIRLEPDDPTILEHIGDAYLKTRKRRKALEYYRRSLRSKKDDTMAIRKKIQDLTKE